jgi:hypothetical protein
MPLQELKQKTTSSEFTEWLAFLKKRELEKANEFNPLYFYFAQIAAEIKRGRVKNPSNVSTKEFILKFVESVKPNAKAKEKDSKHFWLSSLGIIGNKKKIVNKKGKSK